jgi:hypothetical protein
MVSDDGVFEIELPHEGVPGVLEPSVTTVRGMLSPEGLARYRALTSKNSAEVALSALRRAITRRLQKRGSNPSTLRVTRSDFKA